MPRNEDRAPLIGLTATPFRGTNEAETKRLAARYGNGGWIFEALGGADAYPHLQRIGILSQVDHELLPGSDIRLSPDELQRLKDLRRLPDEAARRLAADTGGTERFSKASPGWTTTGRCFSSACRSSMRTPWQLS